MKFDYISDIHLDFHCTEYRTTHKNFYKDIEAFAKRLLPPKPSPTLLIAGDTGHRFEQDSYLLTVVALSSDLFVPECPSEYHRVSFTEHGRFLEDPELGLQGVVYPTIHPYTVIKPVRT